MTKSSRLPVLDDNSSQGMVLGWARTKVGALRVVRNWAARHPGFSDRCQVHIETVNISFDPDIHQEFEIDRVNRVGRGWILEG